MNGKLYAAAGFAALLTASLCLGALAEEAKETMELQILATSDTHGRFLPYDYALNAESTSGSLAQVAAAVDELRTDTTILVDAGDTIQDNSSELFLEDELHPMIAAMNDIGYDAWIMGNHECNYGMDVFQKIMVQNNAPLLCGNVYDKEGTPLASPYVLIERGDCTIALIGMITPNIVRWDSENLKEWTVTNPVDETRKAIEEIGDSADILIAVEHMSLENEYEVSGSGVQDLADACPELDLIIAAHGHQMIDEMEINGIPVIENKSGAATLGQVLMELEKTDDTWEITDVTTAMISMADYAAKEELAEELQPYHERAIENAETVIGTMESDELAPANEIAEIPSAQIMDTALIDLINTVQMYYTDAAVSGAALFVNDANLYKGDIRKCDMALVYKYANTLYKMEMNGAQLKKWMEWSVDFYNTYKEGDLTISFNPDIRGYNYDMFAGVNYEVNISREPGSRIENLTWPDGTLVEDDDVFICAVNNYRAGSQLTSYGTVFQEGDELPTILEIDVRGDIGGVRELIGDYIVNVKGGTLTAEVDNNWKITGVDWDEDLHAKAVELLAEGTLTIPSSEDGRTINLASITVDDLN